MDRITEVLSKAGVIAVVGLSDRSFRDSYRIGEFLVNQGYTVYPVNPQIKSVFGLTSYPDLQSVPESIDIVNVFRNPEFAREVMRNAIDVGAGTVWYQLGAEEEEAEKMGRDAGLEVVSGLCIAVEYRRRRIKGPNERRVERPRSDRDMGRMNHWRSGTA